MTTERNIDTEIFKFDWSALTKNDQEQISDEYSHYIELSRQTVASTAACVANIRSLFLMMLIAIILSLQELDNKSIIMTIIAIQFIKAIFSRMFEATLHAGFEIAKKDFSNFITRKLKLYSDV